MNFFDADGLAGKDRRVAHLLSCRETGSRPQAYAGEPSRCHAALRTIEIAVLYSGRFRERSHLGSQRNAAKVTIVTTLPDTLNAATYFIDRNAHEGRSQNIAIECGAERARYQQLLERTNRAGNALRKLGVRPEERVLLLLLDTPYFL